MLNILVLLPSMETPSQQALQAASLESFVTAKYCNIGNRFFDIFYIIRIVHAESHVNLVSVYISTMEADTDSNKTV